MVHSEESQMAICAGDSKQGGQRGQEGANEGGTKNHLRISLSPISFPLSLPLISKPVIHFKD